MKWIAIAGALLVIAGAWGWEKLWRFDHRVESVVRLDGSYKLAEAHNLPEGSPAPYGYGVSIRDARLPVRSLFSTLVFAGRCVTQPAVRWASAQELVIECRSDSPPEFHRPSHDGISIVHVAARS